MLESCLVCNQSVRQKTNIKIPNPTYIDPVFKAWLAGVIDGDGSFNLDKRVNYVALNAIKIKMDVRDINVLYHIRDTLKFGAPRAPRESPGYVRGTPR